MPLATPASRLQCPLRRRNGFLSTSFTFFNPLLDPKNQFLRNKSASLVFFNHPQLGGKNQLMSLQLWRYT